jgi:hypothetical protein
MIRSQVQETLKLVNEDAARTINAMMDKFKQANMQRDRFFQKSRSVISFSHHSLAKHQAITSEFCRGLLSDMSAQNMDDFHRISSAMDHMTTIHQDLERKVYLSNQALERSNIMCKQYKELFEQEQSKVFELIAEKAVWFKEYELCAITWVPDSETDHLVHD